MRNQFGRRSFMILSLVGIVAGCSTFADDGDPDAASASAAASPERLVARITNIELGRTANGYALSVFGLSDTAGWASPRLRPRGTEPDAEGVFHYDFVATPPAEPTVSPMAQLPAARRVRADQLLSEAFLVPLVGLRIWAEAGPAEVSFN